MASTLENLFEQILYSEQKAEERKSQIAELKKQIEDCKKEVQETQNAQQNLSVILKSELEKLSEAEMIGRCADGKKRILEEQLKQLLTKKAKFKHEIDELNLKIEKGREQFCVATATFVQGYGLCNAKNWLQAKAVQEELQRTIQEEEELLKKLAQRQDEARRNNKQQKQDQSVSKHEVSDISKEEEKGKTNFHGEGRHQPDTPKSDQQLRRVYEPPSVREESHMTGMVDVLRKKYQEQQRESWKKRPHSHKSVKPVQVPSPAFISASSMYASKINQRAQNRTDQTIGKKKCKTDPTGTESDQCIGKSAKVYTFMTHTEGLASEKPESAEHQVPTNLKCLKSPEGSPSSLDKKMAVQENVSSELYTGKIEHFTTASSVKTVNRKVFTNYFNKNSQ